MIESIFIKANTKAGFLTQLQAGNIRNNQIAFIIDTHEIWSQGTYFPCPYNKDQVDALIAGLQSQIDTINGSGSGSIDSRIQAAIASIVDGAPATFDTLKELADWIADDQSGAAKMAADIANKVDKVSGKGLSTNDYTDAEQTKLSGIEAGAQVNVKPDWNAASGSAAEILNKPTIPAAQVQSNWNETDQSSKAYIQNKPSIPDDLADLNEDTTHRVVTDTEKATWNGKTVVAASNTNGNIKIDNVETTVYTHPGSGTNPHGTTKSDVGLGNVSNDAQVKGLASGTTEDHVVVFGADGYTIKDSGHILGWNTLAN